MLKFVNPSTVVAKSLQGIVEITLRGASIVFSLICIAAASAYFGLLANLCTTVDTIREEAAKSSNMIMVGSCKELVYYFSTTTRMQTRKFGFDQKSAAGWIIFLSILVIIYQVLAFLQLFLHFKLLHIKIPVYRTFWTLFFIIDIVAMAVFVLFYFCGATAIAVLGGKDWKELIDVYHVDGRGHSQYAKIADHAMKVYSATIAISVFSFIAMLLYIGAVVYFLLAKLFFKQPTHGAVILQLQEDVESEKIQPKE